jgi:hypothetical protein
MCSPNHPTWEDERLDQALGAPKLRRRPFQMTGIWLAAQQRNLGILSTIMRQRAFNQND